MNKSRIQVLIVEDDPTHGKAVQEAFKRSGYQTTLCTSSVKGLLLAQRQEFHCVLADCMLPKMNGVDLVQEIKALTPIPPKVFLFSGIFKDKNFIKNSVEKTGALGFFVKPLDLKDLLNQVDEAFRSESIASDEPKLLPLYKEEPLLGETLVKILTEENTLHGVHLPMLYRRLMASDLSGDLTMITEGGDLNSVSLCQGRIFAVRTPDKDTYFGGLAVGFGFVSPEEVMQALLGPPGKLLGQRLIDSMSLSPHAIKVILGEQLALRLSQTVQNGILTLQWTSKKYAEAPHTLDHNRYEALVTDWMRSKISAEWITPFISMWSAFKLQGHYHSSITEADTLNDLLSHEDFSPEQDLIYLFRQLLNGNATLGGRGEDTRNFNFLDHRLSQLLEDYKVQTYFQILSVSEKAQSLELNRALHELKQTFDPEALPASTPPAVRVKAAKVFSQIEHAYETLSDDQLRTSYVMKMQTKRSSKILENEPIFRTAVIELQNGQAKSAVKRLERLVIEKIDFRDLRSYYIWAGLKSEKHFKKMSLDQVPPEERHSAPYLMAKGVWHRQRGQLSKALESFRTAHVLDPRLTIARAEVETLKSALERSGANKQLLKDVTMVFENIVGKTRRGA